MDELEINYPKKILDINAERIPQLYGVKVCYPDFKFVDKDSIYVITIKDVAVSTDIKKKMYDSGAENIYTYVEINRALLVALWRKRSMRRLLGENTCSVRDQQ